MSTTTKSTTTKSTQQTEVSMPEQTTQKTQAPTPEATEQTEATPQQQTAPESEPEPADKASKEAAKYRTRLRETEGALQAAQEATQAAQRALAEHLAQARGIKPAALWASGAELTGLLDEDGHVDPEKVGQAVNAATGTLGLSRTPRADRTQGGMGPGVDPTPKFSDAFAPRA